MTPIQGTVTFHLQIRDTAKGIQSYALEAVVAEVGEKCILSLPRLREECGLSLCQYESPEGILGDFLFDGGHTQLPVHRTPKGLWHLWTSEQTSQGGKSRGPLH